MTHSNSWRQHTKHCTDSSTVLTSRQIAPRTSEMVPWHAIGAAVAILFVPALTVGDFQCGGDDCMRGTRWSGELPPRPRSGTREFELSPSQQQTSELPPLESWPRTGTAFSEGVEPCPPERGSSVMLSQMNGARFHRPSGVLSLQPRGGPPSELAPQPQSDCPLPPLPSLLPLNELPQEPQSQCLHGKEEGALSSAVAACCYASLQPTATHTDSAQGKEASPPRIKRIHTRAHSGWRQRRAQRAEAS